MHMGGRQDQYSNCSFIFLKSTTILYLILCVVGSFFLGIIINGLVKFEVDGEIIPTFSKCVSSCLSHAWCLKGNVYGFWFKHLICPRVEGTFVLGQFCLYLSCVGKDVIIIFAHGL